MSSASFKAFRTFLNIDLNMENMEKIIRKYQMVLLERGIISTVRNI